MRIKEKRLLRGPNLYAESPCVMALVDNGGMNIGNRRQPQICFL